MPSGVPVATVALDGARNAGILAAQIIGSHNTQIAKALDNFKATLKAKVEKSASEIEDKGWKNI
jgi:5-(carboxyamino)imidazole ribonucleotide mutase